MDIRASRKGADMSRAVEAINSIAMERKEEISIEKVTLTFFTPTLPIEILWVEAELWTSSRSLIKNVLARLGTVCLLDGLLQFPVFFLQRFLLHPPGVYILFVRHRDN